MRRGRKLLLEDDQKFFLVHTTHPLARGASRRGEERRGAAVIIKARRTGREGKKWQGGRKEKRNDEIATLAGSVAPLSSLCFALASPRPSRSPLFAHRETALKLSMERRGGKKKGKKRKGRRWQALDGMEALAQGGGMMYHRGVLNSPVRISLLNPITDRARPTLSLLLFIHLFICFCIFSFSLSLFRSHRRYSFAPFSPALVRFFIPFFVFSFLRRAAN